MRCTQILSDLLFLLKSDIPSPAAASVFLSNDRTAVEMLLSQSHLLHSQIPPNNKNNNNPFRSQFQPNKLTSPLSSSSPSLRLRAMSSTSSSPPHQLNHFSDVANKAADAAGDVIRKYFRRNNFDIIHKSDLSK
jgi:inositol-phosphate phosphatase / L-galactose 1-phosphate phosphatase / histidinol-phosphatase